MNKNPRIVIECVLKNFISEEIPDTNEEPPVVEQKKTVTQKILHTLGVPFELFGQVILNQFTAEKEFEPPPSHPNNPNGADHLCNKTFKSLGYKYTEYSRTDTYKENPESKKNGPRTSVGFQFFIPMECQHLMKATITKIDNALQGEEKLIERFQVNVYEEIKK
jgi:hypothetical protein